ncbi:hypothetical protein PC119_g18281 [Phytophthora cactorum]|uniref:Uncharacterized protein n=1 Tax=Phytophthora cactorum TaxID=29920 RepID=A0A8T1BC50_9STRA|nr:hypothetical protein PC112_g17281 [Phytophthora cactorum]KAG2899116.1 hypothetical protein PC115_g16649 [Phytophthora cactorum]KAG2994298.1 hypothetical protein PC119_g18281 [Phytophthora cactorum]
MGPARRNICAALAVREVTGRATCQLNLPRQKLSLRQVLRHEQGGVLLGFSSDGNFLVYCISLDACYEASSRRRSCSLSIRRLMEHRESSRLCRVVVAPSPMFDEGGLAAAVTSLSFEFSQHVYSQKMEKWQLMQLVKGRTNVYHLLVNAGTAVHVLVFQARRRRETELPLAQASPRGLGISHFPQNAWYYPPVFPIKFQKSTEHRLHNTDSDWPFSTDITCICQHLFDVERFLGEFLETFKPLRHYNLVDYDLRLVRASTKEKTVFMTYSAPPSSSFSQLGALYWSPPYHSSIESARDWRPSTARPGCC